MTLIQRLDGTTYDLLKYGIRTRDVLISSPNPEHEFGKVEGALGVVDYGTTYGAREITCLYRAISHNFTDFSLLRDEIFHLFRTEESFYLIEKRLPGKRWLVKVANPYQIPQRNVYGNFEVNFIGLKGVSESIGTSMDIHIKGIDADSSLWGFGMGLEAVDETLLYRHTVDAGTSFKIFNPSNIKELHPFELDLKITISSVIGSERAFQVNNLTNGSRFWTNIPIRNNDIVEIDGHFVSKNKLNILRDTGRRYIWLSPGWNTFQVLPQFCDKATIEFDFPFYYL